MSNVMRIEKLGDYKLLRVLDSFDYARIFVCKNEKDKLLLFAEMDTNDTFEKWVAVDIKHDTFNELLYGRLSVQRAFINTDVRKYYIITHSFETDDYVLSLANRMPEDVISEDDFFVGIDEEKEQQEIITSAINAFKKSDSPVFDLHFNPYTVDHSLPLGFLAILLENIRRIYNLITKTRRDVLRAEPIPASMLIRIQSVEPQKIIAKNSPSFAFNTIAKIMTSETTESLTDEFKENPYILKSSKELVNCLVKENKNFEVMLTESVTEKPEVKNVEIKALQKLNTELKSYSVSTDEEEETDGILDGYDTQRKTFSFMFDSGTQIKGKLDKDFLIEEHTVLNRYCAKIRTTKVFDTENAKSKNTYTLIALKKKD